MNAMILLSLAALLAAGPAEPWSSSTSASRQPLETLRNLSDRAMVRGNVLLLARYHPWQGDAAEYVGAIRDLPNDVSVVLRLPELSPFAEHLPGVPQLSRLVVNSGLLNPVTNADLSKLRDMPNLAAISLLDCGEVSDVGIAKLAALPGLEELHLGHTRVTGGGLGVLRQVKKLRIVGGSLEDQGMEGVGKMASLEQLHLSGTSVTDAGMRHLSALHNLKDLDIAVCNGIDGSGLRYLAALTRLERLDISSLQKVTDESLAYLADVTSLRELLLPGQISDDGLVHLESLSNIKMLGLEFGNLTDDGMKSVGELSELEELDLLGTQVTDSGLASLRTLTNLRKLNLSKCKTVTGTGLQYLPKGLERLCLKDTNISDEALKHLLRLTNLRELELPSQIGDAGLMHVGRIATLELLVAGGEHVTDAGIKQLVNLSSLRRLHLSANALTYRGLVPLARINTLRTLYLTDVQVNDGGWSAIAGIKGLETLGFNNCNISDDGLESIAELRNLKVLVISSAPSVSDRGLVSVGRLAQLEHLALLGTSVTLKDTASIKRLGNLWTLVTDDTLVDTSTTLTRLWSEFPNVEVQGPWSYPSAPPIGRPDPRFLW